MDAKEISKAVIKRLPRYYRYLGELMEEKVDGGIVSEIERIDYIQNFAIVANQRKVVVKYYENEIYKVKTIEL